MGHNSSRQFTNGVNDILKKSTGAVEHAFTKGGIVPTILKKIGSEAVPMLDKSAPLLTSVGGLATLAGQPEIGVPLVALGAGLKMAKPVYTEVGKISNSSANYIEKPKSEKTNIPSPFY